MSSEVQALGRAIHNAGRVINGRCSVSVRKRMSHAATAVSLLLMAALQVYAAPGNSATPLPAPGLISYDMPRFPPQLVDVKAGDGEVVMVITIDAEGRVNDSVILEATNEAFSSSATAAVSDWRFSAATMAANDDTWPRREVLQFSFKRTGAVTTMSHAEAARDSFVTASTPQFRAVPWHQLDNEPQRVAGAMPVVSKASLVKRGDKPLVISFVIDREGRVRVPVVAGADDPALANAALEAIRQWRYTAPLYREEAVAVEVTRALVLPALVLPQK